MSDSVLISGDPVRPENAGITSHGTSGIDIDKDFAKAKYQLGVVPQEFNFNQFEKVLDIVLAQAGYYGMKRSEALPRAKQLLTDLGLWEKRNGSARMLSGGMKRRLMIARALMHRPKLLILDEPTAGVDIELRRALWSNVKALNEQGVTILLTTHYLEEAEELCDRIAIINHGKVIASEDKETLLSRIDNKEIRFRLDRPFDEIPAVLQKFNPEKTGKRSLIIRYSPGEQEIGEIIEAIQQSGHGIADIATKDSDLEDVFLQLTSDKAA